MKLKTFRRFTLLVIALNSLVSVAIANPHVYFNQNQNSSYQEPYRNIIRSGDNLERVILEAINSAESSIFIAVQELRLPLIAKALVAKAKQGVDVRVILENSYNHTIEEASNIGLQTNEDDEDDTLTHAQSSHRDLFAFVDLNGNGILEKHELMERDAMYILRANNIRIIDDTADGSKGSGLMHHKFVVVDGKKTVVSSANFTLSCVHGDTLAPRTRGNHNSLMTFSSVKLAKIFEQEFLYMWGGLDGKGPKLFGIKKPYRGRQIVKIGETVVTVQFSPTSRFRMWKETVNGLIADELSKANHSAHLALFVFSEQRISNVLQEKTLDNPKMSFKLLIEPKFAYRQYSELLDVWGIALKNEKCEYQADNNPWKVPFMTGGAANRENGDQFHHKFAVVDAKTVIFGSQNWSEAANSTNEETLIVVRNQKVAEAFEEEHSRVYSDARLGPTHTLMTKIRQINDACASR